MHSKYALLHAPASRASSANCDSQERLKSHARAFEGLMSLIPAKDYYGKDESITSVGCHPRHAPLYCRADSLCRRNGRRRRSKPSRNDRPQSALN